MGLGLLGLAGRGLGLLGNPYVQGGLGLTYLGSKFNPTSTQQEILKEGTDKLGNYRSGPLVEAYRFIDSLDGQIGVGVGSKLSQTGLENAQGDIELKAIETDSLYAKARRLKAGGYLKSDPTPGKNESLKAYKNRIQGAADKAERAEFVAEDPVMVQQKIDRDDAKNRYVVESDRMNAMLQMNMMNNFNTRRDQLQERIDSRIGSQDILRTQLAQDMDKFNRDLNFQERQDDKSRRESLAIALANLGGIFIN